MVLKKRFKSLFPIKDHISLIIVRNSLVAFLFTKSKNKKIIIFLSLRGVLSERSELKGDAAIPRIKARTKKFKYKD